MAVLKVNQVAPITNAVAKITLGEEAPTIVDSSDFVSLGTKLMQSGKTENFLSTLAARIAKTVIDYKRYKSVWRGLFYDDIEWAAYIQYIEGVLPDAIEDESVELVNGESVDMYKVSKPEARQKFFYSRAAETYKITIQKHWITTAFTGAAGMASFFEMVRTQVLNKMELGTENMGRLTSLNMAGITQGTVNEIHVVTDYQRETGRNIQTTNPLHDGAFMRFFSKRMRDVSSDMAAFNSYMNLEKHPDFTPVDEQYSIIPTPVLTAMETEVLWRAFHTEFVKLEHTIEVPYWLSPKDKLNFSIKVNKTMNDENVVPETKNVQGLLAVLYDRKAMGCYRTTTEVTTTPYNSAGRYWNTYWHGDRFWFNNLSKQFVMFTLT